jgi:hypothetical protein
MPCLLDLISPAYQSLYIVFSHNKIVSADLSTAKIIGRTTVGTIKQCRYAQERTHRSVVKNIIPKILRLISVQNISWCTCHAVLNYACIFGKSRIEQLNFPFSSELIIDQLIVFLVV